MKRKTSVVGTTPVAGTGAHPEKTAGIYSKKKDISLAGDENKTVRGHKQTLADDDGSTPI